MRLLAFVLTCALLLGSDADAQNPAAQNLLQNPDFEAGVAPWVAWAGATIEATTVDPQQGATAALVANRTQVWQGPVQSIPVAQLEVGRSYRVRGWVLIVGSAEEPVGMTIAREDDDGLAFQSLISSRAFEDRWVEIDEWTGEQLALRAAGDYLAPDEYGNVPVETIA